MNLALLIIYGAALTFVFIYSFVQLNLVWNYAKVSKIKKQVILKANDNWPKVTIQLPIFNEKYVVQRLIQNIAQLDYPKNLLEIQILDDSNDETTKIVKKCVDELPNKKKMMSSLVKHSASKQTDLHSVSNPSWLDHHLAVVTLSRKQCLTVVAKYTRDSRGMIDISSRRGLRERHP